MGLALGPGRYRGRGGPPAAKESVPPPTAAIYACDSAAPVALGTSACPRPSAALARPRSESTTRLVRPSDGHRGFGVAALLITLAVWAVVVLAVVGVASAGYGVYRLFEPAPF